MLYPFSFKEQKLVEVFLIYHLYNSLFFSEVQVTHSKKNKDPLHVDTWSSFMLFFFFLAQKEGTGRGRFFHLFFCDRCETRDPTLTV